MQMFHSENQHATNGSLLVKKQKDFSDQKCIDSTPEKKSFSGDGWCRTKHRVTELYGRRTFRFASGRLVSITDHLIWRKNRVNCVHLVRQVRRVLDSRSY